MDARSIQNVGGRAGFLANSPTVASLSWTSPRSRVYAAGRACSAKVGASPIDPVYTARRMSYAALVDHHLHLYRLRHFEAIVSWDESTMKTRQTITISLAAWSKHV